MTALTQDPMVPPADARKRVDAHEFWYHTIDVAPGVTTPGWFDLRHSLDQNLMPFPDVAGKRCLDIGTFDGFYAFEMERRGAAEVVAVDVEDHEQWDWPLDARAGGPQATRDPGMAGPPKGAGFRLISDLIDSKVDWRPINIYDLDPAELGTFDVVVCGTLLLHLRDPVRALEAVRSVTHATDGLLFSCEQIEFWLTMVGRGRPYFKFRGTGRTCQWWQYNSAGHQQLLYSAGFQVTAKSPFFLNRFNVHPNTPWSPRTAAGKIGRSLVTKDRHDGIFHRAVVAERRL